MKFTLPDKYSLRTEEDIHGEIFVTLRYNREWMQFDEIIKLHVNEKLPLDALTKVMCDHAWEHQYAVSNAQTRLNKTREFFAAHGLEMS